MEDEEEEDVDQLLGIINSASPPSHFSYCLHFAAKLPEDCRHFQELYMGCQACMLLLMLKQHLKDLYGFTDAYAGLGFCCTLSKSKISVAGKSSGILQLTHKLPKCLTSR
jgi:hypothetical protein